MSAFGFPSSSGAIACMSARKSATTAKLSTASSSSTRPSGSEHGEDEPCSISKIFSANGRLRRINSGSPQVTPHQPKGKPFALPRARNWFCRLRAPSPTADSAEKSSCERFPKCAGPLITHFMAYVMTETSKHPTKRTNCECKPQLWACSCSNGICYIRTISRNFQQGERWKKQGSH